MVVSGDRGPILHRARRVGEGGRTITVLKIRTMVVSVAGSPLTGPDDPRITRIGRTLRRYRLDELPQLINVVRGDMSLVGPRPERTRFVRSFEEHVYRYGDRHRVKSGLTGWAQVQGLRGQTSLSDRVEWDNYYIENWSLWLDLKIVIATIPAVLGRADNAV
jgi:lipopolysaccharide/colanic/teichoic acid biosynthesis glycosyltransferase